MNHLGFSLTSTPKWSEGRTGSAHRFVRPVLLQLYSLVYSTPGRQSMPTRWAQATSKSRNLVKTLPHAKATRQEDGAAEWGGGGGVQQWEQQWGSNEWYGVVGMRRRAQQSGNATLQKVMELENHGAASQSSDCSNKDKDQVPISPHRSRRSSRFLLL